MSDFDFLKEFGQNLDQERPGEPTEANWETLAAALDLQERSKRRRRWLPFWAFSLTVLGLFALLGTLLWQARSRADRMQADITRLHKELDAKNGVSVADTTIRQVFIVRYDTIYRTVVMQLFTPDAANPVFGPKIIRPGANTVFQKNQNQPLEINNQGEIPGTARLENAPSTASATGRSANQPKADTLPLQNPGDSLVIARTDQTDEGKTQADGATPDQLPTQDSIGWRNNGSMLPWKVIPLPKSRHQPQLPNVFDRLIITPTPSPAPIVHQLRVRNAAVGLTGGILFPYGRDTAFRPTYTYTLGLTGQIGFGRHLRLLVRAEHGSTALRLSNFGLGFFNVPPLTPPSPNDLLKQVVVKQSLWHFSLGLRYVFRPDKRLRPLIGAGWVFEQTQEQTFQYEFRNQLTGEETHASVPRLPATYNANGLQIGAGAEWALTKRLVLGLEGMYTRPYATSVPFLAERWGFKAGLAVRF